MQRARVHLRPLLWLLLVACLASISCRCPVVQRPFHAALYYDLSTLDPHVEATVSNSLLYNLYEALVAVDADLQIRPGLAESWSTPDDLTWHLRLRPDVRFHSTRTRERSRGDSLPETTSSVP